MTDAQPFLLRPRQFKLRLPHAVIEATNWSRDIVPQRKRVIVIHCGEAAERGGTAEGMGNYFRNQKTTDKVRSSAHYCVDNNSIVQCLAPELVAWHAPGANRFGIGIEHAGYSKQTREQWLDAYGVDMLHLSSALVAELCVHFQIPVELLDADDLRGGLTGITDHATVTKAWPDKGSHWDPGPGFPMRDYLQLVRKHTDAGTGFEA